MRVAEDPVEMDPSILKELRVRKRIESIFNKTQDECGSKDEYDQYLEDREDIIDSLCEGVDVEATEAKIAAYQRANEDSILRNRAKKAESMRRAAGVALKAGDGAGAGGGPEAGDAAAAAGPEPGRAGTTEYAATMPGVGAMFTSGATLDVRALGANAAGDLAAPEDMADPQQRMRMALASGWTPDLPKARSTFEAFSQVFVY